MATNTTLCNSCENEEEEEEEEEEEDYINMELTSNILCFSKASSPQNNKDFEFQMTSNHNEKETNTYPADELFYKGKLLPLNLLLSTTAATAGAATFQEEEENYYKIIKCSTAPCTNTTNTPLDSCNISPSESCRVSCELNPDEYFFEWSTEFISTFINNSQTKKSWTSKKLKLIKKSSILGQKLKAFSRTYFKSLFFNKSHEKFQKSQESENDYIKLIAKKSSSSYPTIATIMENIDKEDNNNSNNNNINVQRRSFSGAIKRHSPVKGLSNSSSSAVSSSSSSSSNSSSFSFNSKELYFFRRSSSAKEIEGSIEAAIAHCKKSGFCSLEDQKKQGV